jgi:hypothetical protein
VDTTDQSFRRADRGSTRRTVVHRTLLRPLAAHASSHRGANEVWHCPRELSQPTCPVGADSRPQRRWNNSPLEFVALHRLEWTIAKATVTPDHRISAIIMVAGGANPANEVATFVRGWSDGVSLGFKNLFTPARTPDAQALRGAVVVLSPRRPAPSSYRRVPAALRRTPVLVGRITGQPRWFWCSCLADVACRGRR